MNYFNYQNPPLLAKDVLKATQAKSPENENLKKIINVVEKILNFNKQQKTEGLKILNPKQKLQRLLIALA